jgi:hypothetical protein
MGRLSNNQKCFNKVWQHFVVEKRKQSILENEYTGETIWALRGPYRRRDAIGVLMSDEDYNPDMENFSVDVVVEVYPELQLGTKDIQFLVALERAHDFVVQSDEEFTDRIQIRLHGVAEDFGLKIP